MRIPYRHHWLLRRMDRRLRRSDPHMAAMLAIFARLNAGEAMTSREQAHPDTRLRRGLAWLGGAIAGIVVCLADCASWMFRRVRITCAVVHWRLSGGARAALSPSSAPRPPTYRAGPGLPAG